MMLAGCVMILFLLLLVIRAMTALRLFLGLGDVMCIVADHNKSKAYTWEEDAQLKAWQQQQIKPKSKL